MHMAHEFDKCYPNLVNEFCVSWTGSPFNLYTLFDTYIMIHMIVFRKVKGKDFGIRPCLSQRGVFNSLENSFMTTNCEKYFNLLNFKPTLYLFSILKWELISTNMNHHDANHFYNTRCLRTAVGNFRRDRVNLDDGKLHSDAYSEILSLCGSGYTKNKEGGGTRKSREKSLLFFVQ